MPPVVLWLILAAPDSRSESVAYARKETPVYWIIT